MKKYIEIVVGDKKYRFLIDEELDKILRSLLKDKYIFDENGILTIDDDLIISYEIKQLILKAIIASIDTFSLSPELQNQINYLKNNLGKKSTVYSTDLSRLDNILIEASEIYGRIRNSNVKKDSVVQTTTSDTSIEQVTIDAESIKENINIDSENIDFSSSSDTEKIEELKEIVEEISLEEEFSNKIPVSDIKNALDRIVICSSMEEFIEKTSNNTKSYDIVESIKNNSEKIILPPNTKIEDITVEILKTCINDSFIMSKVITYVDQKKTFRNKIDSAFDTLRSSLKVSGLTGSNLNYFGDQFFNTFEAICRESDMSFESMLRDYFNGYSANRKYNSPIDKFIRLYLKYNGGDDNTRALLEAMLVKKAMARHLISLKYNSYLREDFQNLSVNGNGYINFNENYFRSPTGGIENKTNISKRVETEESTHLSESSHSYEKELNMDSTIGAAKDSKPAQDPDTPVKTSMDTSIKEESKTQELSTSTPKPTIINPRRNKLPGKISATPKGTLVEQSQIYAQQVTGLSGRRFTSNTSLNPSLIREEAQINTTIEEETTNKTDSDPIVESDTSESDISSNNNSSDYTDTQKTDVENDNLENNIADKNKNPVKTTAEEIKDQGKKEAKKLLLAFIKKHPLVLVIGGLLILLFILLLISASNIGNNKNNSFGLGGYDYLELSNVCEEIYVYDTPSGEDGLYPLEEYVAGVVSHEIGAFDNDTMYEVFAIAARTYALRRLQNSSDCSIPGNTTAQVFGKTDNQKIIDAVNRTRGLVLTENNNLVSTEYDAFCWDTKDDNYYNICQKNHDTGEVLKVPIEWAREYVGKISGQKFLTTPRYQSHGRGMSQDGAFYLASEKNYNRGEILTFFYGSEAKLMSIYKSSYSGEFPLDPNDPLYKNLKLLVNKSLNDVLVESNSSVEEFNNYLANIVETSGVGTREAVVNVGVSLIGNLANMGYKLNYQWGGKYYYKGVNPNWGTSSGTGNCGSYGKKYDINKCLTHYRWSSFDCSGFVNWALLNGLGYNNESEYMRSGVYNKTRTESATRVNLNSKKAVCQAGDVLIKAGSHIVLIVGIDDSRKSYIVAESTGSDIFSNSGGVKLSYYGYGKSGYFCGDMSSIYNSKQMEEE